MSDNGYHGRFVWYELLTHDPEVVEGFYTDVVGWDTSRWEGAADEPYVLWIAGGRHIGGLMRLPEEARRRGAPPHWLPYIGAPELDHTVARARELGGSILVKATEVPEVGRYAVLTDPQGAVFAVFRPPEREEGGETDAANGEDGAPGDFCWHELGTSDLEAGFHFYQELFGWRETDSTEMEDGIYRMYGRGERSYGGMYELTPEMGLPPHWLGYVRVEDVQAAAERVRQGGGTVRHGPMEVPGGGWIVQCRDPQGALFALHAPPPADGEG